MFDSQSYAFKIQVTARAIFHSNKGDIGGIADVDFIEKSPFLTMTFVLGNFYNKVAEKNKSKIDRFFEDYYLEMGKSIEDIGEEIIKEAIDEFNEIIKIV